MTEELLKLKDELYPKGERQEETAEERQEREERERADVIERLKEMGSK